MTIKELYEEAKKQGKEDYEIFCGEGYEPYYAGQYGWEYDDEKKEVSV